MKHVVFQSLRVLLILITSNLFPNALSETSITNKQASADRIRSRVGLKIASEKKLNFIGMNAQMLNEIQKIGLSFEGFHNFTLEESRNLMVYAVNTFLDAINSDENIRPFLKEYPFSANNVKIQIWLYDLNYKEVKPPNINYIVCNGGKIEYHSGEPEFNRDSPLLVEDTLAAIKHVEQSK